MFTFVRNFPTVSRVAGPFRSLASKAGGFQRLHVLVHTWHCRYMMVSHCGLNLHFPNNSWCWKFFHVFICHPCILFDEVTSAPFLLDCCFLIVEFWKFFVFLDISPFLDLWFVSIFSKCVSCLLILLRMSPPEQKFYIYVHLVDFLKMGCAFWLSKSSLPDMKICYYSFF